MPKRLPSPSIAPGAPFIDKLALTVKVADSADQLRLLDALLLLGDDPRYALSAGRVKKGYDYSCSLSLTSDVDVFLQVKPRRPGAAFARIELNPSKAGREGMKTYHRIASSLFPDDYACTAGVSRIDIAADFEVAIADLNIRSTRHRKTMTVYGSNGGIETIYLGLVKSKTQVRFYDKARQLREVEGLELKGSRTRVEICLMKFTRFVVLGVLK